MALFRERSIGIRRVEWLLVEGSLMITYGIVEYMRVNSGQKLVYLIIDSLKSFVKCGLVLGEMEKGNC